MKDCISKFLFRSAVAIFIGCTAASSEAALFSKDLRDALVRSSDAGKISVILRLKQRGDVAALRERGTRRVRIAVLNLLKDTARLSQKSILDKLYRAKKVTRITPLWIINGIAISAEAGFLYEIENWSGIERIDLDQVIEAPVVASGPSSEPAWNITAIRAPELWELGITGTGIVVASMDSGVDYLHPDLAGRWRGGENSWFDPNGEHLTPFDSNPIGHGTSVMGVMIGGSASGTAIGVAPGARWIAVKIFNDSGEASLSSIHLGFQWLMDPDGDPLSDDAPDVVNNSWGFDADGDCIEEFKEGIEVLRAAGIGVVAAAGNSGPSDGSSISPANYADVVSAGSVDDSGTIASSSSRGPSACDGAIFPDLVAPGVSITSADRTFGGAFPDSYSVLSGTSFAAPHLAGAMALLMSAFPHLTAYEIEDSLIEAGWDLGEPGPDNAYGYGLTDVMEAYLNITYRSSIRGYYNAILDREPDIGGAEWWLSAIKDLTSFCIDRREGFGGLAQIFFESDEYALRAKDERGYVIDLYESFLRRTPSEGEIGYWIGELQSGKNRNAVLLSFLYSEEFSAILDGLFGQGDSRPECNMVNDFYRGFLSRFPDEGGFMFWRGMIRDAQCQGSEAVLGVCREIAHLFSESPEYLDRARGNGEYVEDLYNAILRRGPDMEGYSFWLGLIESRVLTRSQVLDFFLDSPEFSLRVSDIVKAGCLN